jgi:hypothetical protein
MASQPNFPSFRGFRLYLLRRSGLPKTRFLDTKTRSTSVTVDKRSKLAIPPSRLYDCRDFTTECIGFEPSSLHEQMHEQLAEHYRLLEMQSNNLRAQLAAQ